MKKRTRRNPGRQPRNVIPIDSLVLDDQNARRRTDRSKSVLQHSVETLGMGRSVLLDAEGRLVAGNGTLEAAREAGIENVRIIETDGTELIAVKRINLSGLESTAMAVVDNRSSELAAWDYDELDEALADLCGEYDVDLLGFDDEVISVVMDAVTEPKLVEFYSNDSSDSGETNEEVSEEEPPVTIDCAAGDRVTVAVTDEADLQSCARLLGQLQELG